MYIANWNVRRKSRKSPVWVDWPLAVTAFLLALAFSVIVLPQLMTSAPQPQPIPAAQQPTVPRSIDISVNVDVAGELQFQLPPVANVSLVANTSTITANGTDQALLTATVNDSLGAPIAGKRVNFTL